MDLLVLGACCDSRIWGTWAEWFSAVGSVAAFGLGVWILMRDRTLRRQSTANTFVTFPSSSMSASGALTSDHKVKIRAHNVGNAPVPVAIVEVKPPQGPLKYGWMSNATDTFEIAPQTHTEVEIELGDVPAEECRIVIVFTDERGQRWQRDLDSNEYLSKRGYAKFKKIAP